MFGVIVRRSLSLQRGAFTDLVFFLVLVLSCRGQELIGPSQPIVALVGDDVTLPCHLEPSSDAFDLTVEWARPDLDPRYILVRRNGAEAEYKTNPSYKGRAQMFPDELKHGNVSLKLSKVQLSDEAEYRCFIPSLSKAVTLQLLVESTNPRTTHDPPGSHVVTGAVIGCVVFAVVFIAAVVFVLWKQGQIRLNNKPDEDRTEQPEDEKTEKPGTKSEKHQNEEGAPLIATRDEEDKRETESKKERLEKQSEMERSKETEETQISQQEEKQINRLTEQLAGSTEEVKEEEVEEEEEDEKEETETKKEQTKVREREAESPEVSQLEAKEILEAERKDEQVDKEQHEPEKWFSVVQWSVRKSGREEPDTEVMQNYQPVMTELLMKMKKM